MNAALWRLGKLGEYRAALTMLKQMEHETGHAPNRVSFNLGLEACARSAQAGRAIDLLEGMQSSGIEPNEHSFSSTITACARSGQWELAVELLEEQRRCGVPLTPHSFNAAISACARAGQPDRALALIDIMWATGVEVNVVSYSSAINACARVGNWEKALLLVVDMASKGIEPNEITFMAAIRACAEARQWERALLILTDDMAEYGVVPTAKSFNAVISACVKSGKLERAMQVVDMMADFNCSPDVRTVTTLLHAVVKTQGQLVKSTGRCGVRKKSIYFADATSLVQTGSRRRGRAEAKCADKPASAPPASRIESSSGSVGMGASRSDGASGSGMEAPLISSYLELGEEELALALVNAYWRKPKPEASEEHAASGTFAVGAAVGAAVSAAEAKTPAHTPSAAQTQAAGEIRLVLTSALVMLEEILGSDENNVDADCLNVAITACFQTGDWPGVIYLFSELERAGIAPDAANYRAVIVALDREGDWRRALELYDEFLVGAVSSPSELAAEAEARAAVGVEAGAEAGTTMDAEVGPRMGRLTPRAYEPHRDDRDDVVAGPENSETTAVSSTSPSGSTTHIQALRLELGPGLGCTLAALRACAKGGEWRRALALCRTLDIRQPSQERIERAMIIRGFTQALRACQQAREAGAIMDVLAVMQEYGLKPNIECFTIAIRTLEDAGKWQLALEVVDMMRQHGHDPVRIEYGRERLSRNMVTGGPDAEM